MYKFNDLEAKYKEKLVDADEAVGYIRDNDKIYFGAGCGVVKDLDKALARRINCLRGIEIVSLINFASEPFATYKASNSNEVCRFASTHFGGVDRMMKDAGRCWYIPIQFRELPNYWSIENNNFDVVMIQVSPMDKYGNFNLGPQVTDLTNAIRKSKVVMVEVNKNMPVAHGFSNTINLSEVDYIVEGSNTPVDTLETKAPSETDYKIAEHLLTKIHSGSTIQLGIGSLPTCIGQMLCESDIKDLSCHTEMLTDAYLDLYKAGKLSNRKKILDGKMVYTFAGGRRELFEFIDDNPMLCCTPVNYVNNIDIISSIDDFVSVNSCVQVDLYGQIASETIGAKHYSGTGGQLDFVMGAYKSHGGKSFICVPSTKTLRDGTVVSTISPTLPDGAVVTTPRMVTNYVVTEFGAVNLKGRSTWERAEMLISIAHPDFREQLIQDAEKLGLWKTTSKCTW